MPNYIYEGLDKSGNSATGEIVCNNDDEAKRKLQQQGFYITQLSAAGESNESDSKTGSFLDFSFSKKKVKYDKIVDFLRQLSTLVEAKLPLARSLAALIEQEEEGTFNPRTDS